MTDLYKRYEGNILLEQSSYEVDFYDSEYHLYRCLTEKEVDEFKKGKDNWRISGNRFYLYSCKNIDEIERAIKSYWKASTEIIKMCEKDIRL